MASKKSAARRNAKSSKGLLSKVFDWFLAPRRKSVYAEDDRYQVVRKSKPAGGAGKQRPAKRAASASEGQASVNEAGVSVDKQGRVRLAGLDRVLFASQKGSRKATLLAARAAFDENVAQLDRVESWLAAGVTAQLDLEQTEAAKAVLETFHGQPGLPASADELSEAEARAEAIQTRLDEISEANRKSRLDLILDFERRGEGALDQLPELLAGAKRGWAGAPRVEAVHATALEKRFQNAQKRVEERIGLATENAEALVLNRAELLDTYAELLAEEPSESTKGAADTLHAAWRATSGAQALWKTTGAQIAAPLAQRYGKQEQTQAGAAQRLDELIASFSAQLDQSKQAAGVELARIVARLEVDQLAPARLSGLEDQLRDCLSQLGGDLDARQRQEVQRAQRLVAQHLAAREAAQVAQKQDLEQAKQNAAGLISAVEALTPDHRSNSQWRHWEDQRSQLRQELVATLRGLPRPEAGRVQERLGAADKRWNQLRADFFDALDQGREANRLRKMALIDQLTHAPELTTAKQFDQLLATTMDQWKQIGRAEREIEEELWEEFRQVRSALAAERDELRASERGERLESMSAAFIRKRERLGWLEWLANHDRYLARQKDSKVHASDLAAKDREIGRLRKQLFDIQRKLNRQSPLGKKPQEAAPSGEGKTVAHAA